MNNSIGLIESKGLVALVEAADVILKNSPVKVLGIHKLDNGLVVALQNTPTKTIAAKLRVNYGSSHEREGEEGMAHRRRTRASRCEGLNPVPASAAYLATKSFGVSASAGVVPAINSRARAIFLVVMIFPSVGE